MLLSGNAFFKKEPLQRNTMVSEAVTLQVVAIFTIFIASCLGFLSPLLKQDQDMNTPVFRMMKTCGAGIMMGIALIHLLPDADGYLLIILPSYPLAFPFTAFGVVLVLTIEQCTLMYMQSRLIKQTKSGISSAKLVEMTPSTSPSLSIPECNVEDGHIHTHIHDHDHPNDEDHSHQHCADPNSHCHTHDVGLLDSLIESGDSLQDVIVVYALEISIAIHSVIIGVDLGLSNNIVTISTLIVALSFHQFLEGFGLGMNILNASKKQIISKGESDLLSSNKLFIFTMVFALTVPIGIVIGMCSTSDSWGGTLAKGVANTLAAGSLLYISVGEMIATYFCEKDLILQPYVKLGMLFTLFLGVVFTSILAIWA